MKRQELENRYWNYYKHIEDQFMETNKYVYFDKDNFNVYSYAYISLLLIIGSEVDVLFKEICGYPDEKNKNMGNYKQDVFNKIPDLDKQEVEIAYFGLKILPFKDLTSPNGMTWWKNYNSVKHNRQTNIKLANLETVLIALAALFLLNRFVISDNLGKDEYYYMNKSRLFKTRDSGVIEDFGISLNEEGKPFGIRG